MHKLFKVSLQKNSIKWVSFSMIAILFVSLSFIAIYPTLSNTNKIISIDLNYDISKDLETSDSEKDLNEETLNLFCFEFSKVKFQKSSSILKKIPTVFLIPRVFYEIQLLPPEALIG